MEQNFESEPEDGGFLITKQIPKRKPRNDNAINRKRKLKESSDPAFDYEIEFEENEQPTNRIRIGKSDMIGIINNKIGFWKFFKKDGKIEYSNYSFKLDLENIDNLKQGIEMISQQMKKK